MGKFKEYWDFIKNQRINKKMIPVKAFGAFLNMGTVAIFPYLTLQMTDIGLNYSDISIVYGLVPCFTFLGGPISGKNSPKKLLKRFCNFYLTTFHKGQ